MIWQDLIATPIGIFFFLALLPQLVYHFKHKKCEVNYFSSIFTSLGLFVLAFVNFTLGMIMSSVFTALTGVVWVLFVFQKKSFEGKTIF